MFFDQPSPREILNQKYNIKNPDVNTLCKVIEDGNRAEAEKIQIVKLHLLINVCAWSWNKNGDTPLHSAAAEDSTEVLRLLLDSNRGYVNVVDQDLSTPLHWAAYNGKADNVKLLLEYGAKDRENSIKRTAYVTGKINGHSFPGLDQVHKDMERKQENKNEAINQLKALGLENNYNPYIGYPFERALLDASEKGDLTKVSLLFIAGTNLNTTRDDRGSTPLHLAVINGHLDVVRFLLNNGAENDIKNKLGLTALWFAEADNKIEMIALLTTKPYSTTPDSADSFMDSFIGGKVALSQEQPDPSPATIVLPRQPELVNKSEINKQPQEQKMDHQTSKIIDEKPDSFAEKLDVLINSIPKINLPVAKQVLVESEEKPPESIPEHFATPKRDSHQSEQPHQDFYTPPQINHSQNTVKRLQDGEGRNGELRRLIGLPDFVNISDALATGDCFYDSMAQALNSLFDASEYTHQKLRKLCFDAISELEQSASPTYTWLKSAVEQDSPDMTFEEYRMRMQYDASTLEELKAADPLIPWGDVIWGRPHIEGKLLCDLLGVKLHVIEVQDVPEGPAKQIVTEQLIDPNIDKGKSKSIETLDRKTFAPGSGYVHLLVTRGHFEPILPNNHYHKISQLVTEKPIQVGTSAFEGPSNTAQPPAQKPIQSSVQKVAATEISSLTSRMGFFKVEDVADSIISKLFGEEYSVFPEMFSPTFRIRKFTDSTDEEKLRCCTILKDAGIDFVIEKSVLDGVIYTIQNETPSSLTNKLEKALRIKQLTASAMMY